MSVFLTLYSYAHLTFVGFEHSVYQERLMTSFIMLLGLFIEHSLIDWYRQFVTIHCVDKCMSCHDAIGGLVTTGRGIVCLLDYI